MVPEFQDQVWIAGRERAETSYESHPLLKWVEPSSSRPPSTHNPPRALTTQALTQPGPVAQANGCDYPAVALDVWERLDSECPDVIKQSVFRQAASDPPIEVILFGVGVQMKIPAPSTLYNLIPRKLRPHVVVQENEQTYDHAPRAVLAHATVHQHVPAHRQPVQNQNKSCESSLLPCRVVHDALVVDDEPRAPALLVVGEVLVGHVDHNGFSLPGPV